METRFNTDPNQGAFQQHMIDHLAGPLGGGAVRTALTITNAGHLAITWDTREPLLWLAPVRDLEDEVWEVSARLDPDGADVALPGLTFAAYTLRGAALPVYIPPVNDVDQTAVPFTLALRLRQVSGGRASTIRANQLAGWLEAGLIEGVTGRVLFLLGSEKLRIRRQAREIKAMRQLDRAARHALDRIGADLGVPRFAEDIRFQRTSRADEPFNGEIITRSRTEPDAEYRRRLALYRPFVLPSRRRVLELLNGAGEPDDPNAGLLGALGLRERFRLAEADNPFGIAIHLVAVDGGGLRQDFLDYIRRVYLIFPVRNTANNRIHRRRYLPRFRAQEVDALRDRLAAAFEFADAGSGLAPLLAEKLDVVGRCLAALRLDVRPRIVQAQADNGGSRYALGLGAQVETLRAAAINRLAEAVSAFQTGAERHPDAEVDALLRGMTPLRAADDDAATWFFRACGMQTVHRLNTDHLYLSHFPIIGMVISGEASAAVGEPLPLEVRYHAEGDPGANAMLVRALQTAAQRWADAGGPAWDAVTDADAPGLWSRAQTIDSAATVALVLRGAGLPVLNDPRPALESLAAVPGELHESIVLDTEQSRAIVNNDGDAMDRLRQLSDLLSEAGIASILPLLLDGDRLLLILGAIGLPQVGVNLSQRRATGFRWYVTPLQTSHPNPGVEFKPIGSRTTFRARDAGLYALVAVGYARLGDTDPYEYRVELPDEAVLNLKQYEFLMNILERSYPVGVEINTFTIRRRHVDMDGDGAAEPLLPAISRTYRPFVRKRNRGQEGVEAE